MRKRLRYLGLGGWMGALALGCSNGAHTGASSAPAKETETEVVVCSASEGVPTEYYVLPAINAKLAYYPDFAREVGVAAVSDCEGARAYMSKYREYSLAHPDFDRDQPVGTLNTPREVPVGPAAKLETTKLLNGTGTVPGGFRNQPVVHLRWQLKVGALTLSNDCTGVFIAKNWIMTAAHCLTVVSPDNVPLGDPPFPFTNTPLPNDHFPALRLWGYSSWSIEWPADSGDPSADTRAVVFTGAADVLQYPDPRYQGGASYISDDPRNDVSHDVALLYLDADIYDGALPPRVDTGAAMRISATPVDVNDDMTVAGFGGTHQLRAGVVPDAFDASEPFVVKATVGSSTEPVICKGDSGGPLYRMADVGQPQLAPVLVGISSEFELDTTPDGGVEPNCARPGDTERWRLVQPSLDFINQALQLWNGSAFTCKPPAGGGSSPDFVECWGAPCGGPTGNDCDDSPTDYCSRGGADVELLSTCTTCGDGTCSCIVGQCLARTGTSE